MKLPSHKHRRHGSALSESYTRGCSVERAEAPAVQAIGLAAGYLGNPVIRDVELDVRQGEVVALLGPNGAGKTTTLMALAGALPVLSGEVRLGGIATKARLHDRAKAGLGFVTETRSVFMRLTVADNLRLGRCDTDYALELFPELRPLLSRIGGQLSGGEQQILSVARALARRPTVLLADELSLGLAPLVVSRLLRALRSAADNGMAVLLVEQHIHQALKYADRAYVLDRGKIQFTGSVDEVAPRLEAAYLG